MSRGPKAGIEDVLIEQFAHEERVEAMHVRATLDQELGCVCEGGVRGEG